MRKKKCKLRNQALGKQEMEPVLWLPMIREVLVIIYFSQEQKTGYVVCRARRKTGFIRQQELVRLVVHTDIFYLLFLFFYLLLYTPMNLLLRHCAEQSVLEGALKAACCWSSALRSTMKRDFSCDCSLNSKGHSSIWLLSHPIPTNGLCMAAPSGKCDGRKFTMWVENWQECYWSGGSKPPWSQG